MRFLTCCIVCILLFGSAPRPSAAQITTTPLPYAPRIEDTPCAVEFPPDANVRCGFLIVPENRAKPGGRLIKIAFAVGKARGPNAQPDPVIYLHGGPGMSVIGRVRWWPFSPFRQARDVIVLDQRGAGLSEPSLDCPELSDLPVETLLRERTFEQAASYHADRALQCALRLTTNGADLTHYTNTDIAADVDDLRKALGYAQVNLFAWSAGTRAALYLLRDFPTSVRAAILDSVFMPPGVDYYADLAKNAAATFETFFAACDAQAQCREMAGGSLKGAFIRATDRLRQTPVQLAVKNPLTGSVTSGRLNSEGFVGLLYRLMYEAYRFPILPKLIVDVANGNTGELSGLLEAPIAEPIYYRMGLNQSIHCTESEPFTTLDHITATWAAVDPHFKGFYHFDLDPFAFMQFCAKWPTHPADPRDNQPVKSDVPALILSGTYDPASPPVHGRFAAQTLTRSTFIEFPTMGHFVWEYGGDCPKAIALSFLDAPDIAPDAGCMAAMPALTFGTVAQSGRTGALVVVAGTAAVGTGLAAGVWLWRRASSRTR